VTVSERRSTKRSDMGGGVYTCARLGPAGAPAQVREAGRGIRGTDQSSRQS
jgi:hypothetical protein